MHDCRRFALSGAFIPSPSSSAADFITGVVLPVDGGASIGF